MLLRQPIRQLDLLLVVLLHPPNVVVGFDTVNGKGSSHTGHRVQGGDRYAHTVRIPTSGSPVRHPGARASLGAGDADGAPSGVIELPGVRP